jgi:hypothetical protein
MAASAVSEAAPVGPVQLRWGPVGDVGIGRTRCRRTMLTTQTFGWLPVARLQEPEPAVEPARSWDDDKRVADVVLGEGAGGIGNSIADCGAKKGYPTISLVILSSPALGMANTSITQCAKTAFVP